MFEAKNIKYNLFSSYSSNFKLVFLFMLDKRTKCVLGLGCSHSSEIKTLLLTFQEVELDNVPGESPYIGKARYKRNMFIREGYISAQAQQLQLGKVQQEEDESCRKPQLESHLQSLDKILQDKEEKIHSGKTFFLLNEHKNTCISVVYSSGYMLDIRTETVCQRLEVL